jgi:hypothetical protein
MKKVESLTRKETKHAKLYLKRSMCVNVDYDS